LGQIARITTLGPVRNPIDMGSVGPDWSQLADIFTILERNGLRGPTVVYAHSAPAPGWDENMAEALIARARRCEPPVVVLAPGGLRPEIENRYTHGGIPIFRDTAACFESLQCWYRALPPVESGEAPRLSRRIEIERADGFLNEAQSAAVLRQAGVPMVRSEPVAFLDEAKAAALAVGYPVVLKALAPGVAHKSADGLVAIGIRDPQALEDAFRALQSKLSADVPFLVQPMIAAKAELIVGVSREAPLGHFLVFGLGGVHAETLDEVSLVPIPVSGATLRERIESARVSRLAPVEELARILEALQALVLQHPERIDSIDVNPLLVTAQGCIAVDALIVLNKEAPK
jgi:acyl-CoA synthetase (NDP forming)